MRRPYAWRTDVGRGKWHGGAIAIDPAGFHLTCDGAITPRSKPCWACSSRSASSPPSPSASSIRGRPATRVLRERGLRSRDAAQAFVIRFADCGCIRPPPVHAIVARIRRVSSARGLSVLAPYAPHGGGIPSINARSPLGPPITSPSKRQDKEAAYDTISLHAGRSWARSPESSGRAVDGPPTGPA